MTTRKAASNLKKIRFLNAFSLGSFSLGRLALGQLSLGGLEAVTGAAHGFQVAWILRIRLDFFTDPAHVHVYRPRSHVRSVAPNRIQQMIAGKYAAQVACKVIEQPK